MAATGLKRRVEALETRGGGAFVPWIAMTQYEDQTEEEARAAYEAEHGPIGDCNSILWVVVRKPGFSGA